MGLQTPGACFQPLQYDMTNTLDINLKNSSLPYTTGYGGQGNHSVDIINSDLSSDLVHFSNINIYPNPTSGHFAVSLIEFDASTRVQVLDFSGRVVLENLATESIMNLDISNQPSGVYIVKILSEDGVATRKIIKQ